MDQGQGFKLPPWLQMGGLGQMLQGQGGQGMPQGMPQGGSPQGMPAPAGGPPQGMPQLPEGAGSIDHDAIRKQMMAGGPPQMVGAPSMPPWLQGQGMAPMMDMPAPGGGPPQGGGGGMQMPQGGPQGGPPQGMPQLPPGFKMPPGMMGGR